MKYVTVSILCLLFLIITGCNDQQSIEGSSVSSSVLRQDFTYGGKVMEDILTGNIKFSDVPQTKWDSLSGKKIYFGHQSVGSNILDGLRIVLS